MEREQGKGRKVREQVGKENNGKETKRRKRGKRKGKKRTALNKKL